ncbi:MAG: dolichol-phosphate mannosyltransferase [Actinomycetota bacterium]|jgi:dolichol-phosphate mannosyltransferase|nr:dolichol-phosphate mannosyltransferase [Actinomycetota bacterium]
MRNSLPDGPRASREVGVASRAAIESVSVIVPTFNEALNISALVERLESALEGLSAEVIFVDDSTDETPAVITAVAATSSIPITLLHRESPEGGLGGAVVAGLNAASNEWCVVMDGDLQHPPELIPALLVSGSAQDADVVVASRYVKGGSSNGLNGGIRHLVSSASTVLTRAMFPRRLRDCTDPMTGFFAINTTSIDLESLRPRGFKILLEVLARNSLRVTEEPFVFAARYAGESKASLREGIRFLLQLAALRFGRLSAFAVIGAFGAVANIAIMALLQTMGVWYLAAAGVAALVTIVGNFLLQERFVFGDLRGQGRSAWARFAQSMTFNLSETAIRTALLWVIVESTVVPSLIVQAVLIAVGFTLRFIFHSRIVYRIGQTTSISYDLDGVPAQPASVPVDDGGRQYGKIG